jgi:cellulose synthase/poly-beta-1,6-N-acetylglucosamine synthase-like glycosyltransferase
MAERPQQECKNETGPFQPFSAHWRLYTEKLRTADVLALIGLRRADGTNAFGQPCHHGMSASPADPAAADIAIVIVNYRTPDLTERCLAAVKPERDLLPKLRAVVVDGGSGDDSAARLAEVVAKPDYAEWVTLLPLSINGGFGWANNQAILTLAGQSDPPEFIHLLNPDTEIAPGAVKALVGELLNHPRCGAAGSQLLD